MVRIFSQYVSPKSLLLRVLESLLTVAALVCAARLRFWDNPSDLATYTQLPDFAWQMLFFVAVFQVCFYYSDLYNLNAIRRHNEQWLRLGQSLGAGCVLLGLVYFLFPSLLVGLGVFFLSTILTALFVGFSRLTLDTVWRLAAPEQNVAIFGTEELAATVAEELTRRPDLNLRFLGFVGVTGRHVPLCDSARAANRRESGTCVVSAAAALDLSDQPWRDTLLGTGEHLEQLVAEHEISRLIVALEDRRGALPVRELVKLRVQGVRVEDAQSTLAALTGRVWLRTVRPSWFVFSDGFHRSRLTLIAKRVIDLSCGIIGLVLSAPVMLLIAVAIWLDSKGAVIYRQARVGLRGKVFDLFKFRSMRADAEAENGACWAKENDPRVTRVGRILRHYRLDELPQFLNVIRGEMSFVGPRPERPVFVERLRNEIPYYDERHTVRPGLTGWAQVQYRYGSSIEDATRKLEYDFFYLKNMSVLFDCVIISKTVRIVLTGWGSR